MQHFIKKNILAVTLAAATTTTIVGCASTTSAGVVGADRKQLLLISSQEIMQLSHQAYLQTINEARTKGRLDNNTAQVRRLHRIANHLIPQTAVLRPDATHWDWKVHAITDNQINAYVMPSGKIVFYTGIIERLRLTDAEIAAVMGHEMAHALREHSREKASRHIATQGALSIAVNALGLSGGQAQLVGLAGQLGLDLPHSRTQEAEADKIGIELMARAGYDPNAAVTLWQKMQSAGGNGVPQFLSTHPSSTNRIANLKALVPTVMPLYQASQNIH
ncbi:peptidase M48 [Moraxella catarrhalis]|uniref:M48 family metallopeptidase n=1 Tax=Moraxella catarrhalis TaxID=480 RepID=UPI00128D732C|nr:M48 family metallopeptidase [Moraxella catarrhalis]MPX87872.1 peptidase M48 [Moraxella catarrhalis]